MTHILIPRSDNQSAKIIEASDWEKYGCGVVKDYVICGFNVSAGTGRAVNISTGNLRVNGLFVNNSTTDTDGFTFCTDDTHYLYVTIDRDPTCEPQGWCYSSNTTGTTPADSIMIAKVVTAGGSVSTVNQTVEFKKMHQLHFFVGSGAEIAALTRTYSGQLVYVTTGGSCFSADSIYVRNTANTAWTFLTLDQLPYLTVSTTIGCYTTPASVTASSSGAGTVLVCYLVVGGGGGGASYNGGGGGGGAGGGHETGNTNLTAGANTITVGAGGLGGNYLQNTADACMRGGTSQINCDVIAYGGNGGNKGFQQSNYRRGGVGGNHHVNQLIKSGGNNGCGNAAGGGGASKFANGGNGSGGQSNPTGGTGGSGTNNSITGSSVGRGGGGGGAAASQNQGGTGGSASHGGGRGGSQSYSGNNIQQPGQPNTGGGGGAGAGGNVVWGAYHGQAGGSGVVILKYCASSATATGGTITTSGAYKIHTFTTCGTFCISSTQTGNNQIDDITSSYWISACESEPNSIYDLTCAREIVGFALNVNTCASTVESIKIRTKTTNTGWSDSDNVAHINLSDFSCNTWRYIPINFSSTNKRYVQIIGVGTGVLSLYEVKIRYGVSDTVKILNHAHGTRITATPSSFVDTN